MSTSSLYGNVGNVIVSANNLTTLYNATGGNVVTANVPDKDFTTLYTTQVQIEPTRAYGNSNVEAFLNAGFDAGGNIVQNINANGYIHANGNLTIEGTTSLGDVANVHILGGNLNYVLQTDGAGNLNWVAQVGTEGNTIPYTHFDVTATANNQQFTSTNLGSFATVNDMAVFKNGVNIEPSLYSKPSANVLQINILLNTGDTIDVLPSASGGGSSNPGGNLTEVQYNGGAVLSGNSSFTFDQPNSTLHVGNVVTTTATTTNIVTSNITANGNVTLGDVANVHISGGINGQSLITNGLGGLSWGSNPISEINAYINNVHISGGTNGQVLSTDGSNNLSWTSYIANANYANTANNSNFANVANLANSATIANSATTAGSAVTAATVTASAQPNITSFGTLTGLNVGGSIFCADITAGNVYANFVSGNGYQLFSINGANITGQVANALVAGTVYTNAQPNITSVGTLTSLTVTGNITSGNATLGNLTTSNNFSGNGSLLTAINGSNVTGQVAYAAIANSVAGGNVSGTVLNATFADIATTASLASFATDAGNVTVPAQANITSLGTLTGLTVAGMTNIQEATEKFVPNNTGATGTVNFDVLTSAIILQTANASANFTLNIRGNSSTTFNSIASNNQSVSITYVNKNGATGYYANVFKIDSTTITPVWPFGAPGAGTANGYDVYNFNILKTNANTYVVFAVQGGYQ